MVKQWILIEIAALLTAAVAFLCYYKFGVYSIPAFIAFIVISIVSYLTSKDEIKELDKEEQKTLNILMNGK